MSKLCPNCKYQNEDSASFCQNCGTKLDGGQQAAATANQSQKQAVDPNDPYRYYPGYTPPQPASKKQTLRTVGIIAGVVVLLFVLFGAFMIFVLPDLIVDRNYQPPTETYPEGFQPPADYYTLDMSTLAYGDENTMKDFSYTDGWKTMSPSAKRITDFASVLGFWKAVMITDPENESAEGTSYDYFNVEIYGMEEDARVVVNWNRRVIEKTGEEEDLIGGRGGLNGTFQNGSVTAENGNRIEITDFWSDGDKEYAVGRFTWTDGTIGTVGLVRDRGE